MSQTITLPNGIRITGNLERIEVSAAGSVLPLRSPDPVLWSTRLEVRSPSSNQTASEIILSAVRQDLSALFDRPVELPRDRSEGIDMQGTAWLAWEPAGEGRGFLGDLLYVRRLRGQTGRRSVTRVEVRESRATCTLKIAAGLVDDQGFQVVPESAMRPQWLDQVFEHALVLRGGDRIQVRWLDRGEIIDFVDGELLRGTRSRPLVVLTPHEDDGFPVPPELVLRELSGRADLYVVREATGTFLLTDALKDRRLSVFGGAARIYNPGFALTSDPYEHLLLLADRFEDRLTREAAFNALPSEEPSWSHARAPRDAEASTDAPSEGLNADAEVRAAGSDSEPSSPDGLTPATPSAGEDEAEDPQTSPPVAAIVRSSLREMLEPLLAEVLTIREGMRNIEDEMDQLRSLVQRQGSNNSPVSRKLDRITTFVRSLLPEEELEPDLMQHADAGERVLSELGRVVERAQAKWVNSMLVLDHAITAAGESPYEDVDEVEQVLDVMGQVAQRRMERPLGKGLRDVFRDYGLTYVPHVADVTPGDLQAQYRFTGPDGETYVCHEHIKLGTSMDARRCLRIYFTSRAEYDPRLVVGHVGRHFEMKGIS